MINLIDLDLDSISMILNESSLPEHEKTGCADKIQVAFDKWVNQDLNTCDTWYTEEEFSNEGHGFIDLVKVTSEGVVLVDWKTCQTFDRPNFTEEKTEDIQTIMYLGLGGQYLHEKYGLPLPIYMEYRFVDDDGKCKTVTVYAKDWHERVAKEQLLAVDLEYFSQANLKGGPWAMHKPRACFFGSKGGPTCQFWKDCVGGNAPRVNISYEMLMEKRPKSKSAIKDFQNCPEKFRRGKFLGESIYEGIESNVGQVFHACMDNIYKQIKELKEA